MQVRLQAGDFVGWQDKRSAHSIVKEMLAAGDSGGVAAGPPGAAPTPMKALPTPIKALPTPMKALATPARPPALAAVPERAVLPEKAAAADKSAPPNIFSPLPNRDAQKVSSLPTHPTCDHWGLLYDAVISTSLLLLSDTCSILILFFVHYSDSFVDLLCSSSLVLLFAVIIFPFAL